MLSQVENFVGTQCCEPPTVTIRIQPQVGQKETYIGDFTDRKQATRVVSANNYFKNSRKGFF